MLNKKLTFKIGVDELIILLLSLSYAGISSNIIFGFRVIDILLLFFFCYKIGSRVRLSFFILIGLWLLSVAASFYIGWKSQTEFLLSDTRFFLVIVFAAFLGYSLGNSGKINPLRLYYFLIVSTAIVFFFLKLFPFLRLYYVPQSFLSEEHENTVFGPSLVIINYLYVYLVLFQKKRSFLFYSIYLLFALYIYSLRISRQDLVIMLFFFVWSLFYNVHSKIRLKHVLVGITASLAVFTFLYFNQNDRIQGILNPGQDTSFIYRVMSNEAFLERFDNRPIENKLFGFGLGSTIGFFFNEWFGRIKFTILDNTPLTLLMKSGYFGLVTFLMLVFYPLRRLSLHKKGIIIFPILLSMFLFSHVIYNLLYIFGLYFISFLIKRNSKEV